MKKDYEIKEISENNYQLKYQIDDLKAKLMTYQNQDNMISDAQNKIIYLQSQIQEKEKTIEQLKSGDKFKKSDGQMLRMQMQLNNALAVRLKLFKLIFKLKKNYRNYYFLGLEKERQRDRKNEKRL